MDYIILHPCVQTFDSEHDQSYSNQKVRFSAPIGQNFSLAHYHSTLLLLPIRGFYQMKVQRLNTYTGIRYLLF